MASGWKRIRSFTEESQAKEWVDQMAGTGQGTLADSRVVPRGRWKVRLAFALAGVIAIAILAAIVVSASH